MESNGTAHVKALVLDATPLITQPYNHYQNYAASFYTTPTVLQEIKDERARKNLEIWKSLGTLQLRHPTAESIKRVSAFAKATGDYSVLSANDIHILALTYELETELNQGDWRLRKLPGDSLDHLKPKIQAKDKIEEKIQEKTEEPKKKKNRRRGGAKQRAKRESALASESAETTADSESGLQQKSEQEPEQVKVDREQSSEEATKGNEKTKEKPIFEKSQDGEYFEDDDDGEWISVDNLTETIMKHSGEDTTGSCADSMTDDEREKALNASGNQVALATGDFAIQNVSLQMNLNLMNFMSGLRIKRLRNYMLRCHACFKLFPVPKNDKAIHFCPSCGGEGTVLRCAVSIDSATGRITPHLKANFQWNNRGVRYSLASPLSKNSQKRYGKKGFVHSKAPDSADIVRQDQKEYEKVTKQDEWTKRHNDKVLNDWIGSGSADNFISPFAISGMKHHSVRIGRGRYANSSKKKH
ncbi:hypothetical protein HG535_0F05550 [Zygotorulaspora mrakii]|uniref:20S-pre-rRNA D-site endonuclease NOB1 n=1 Tax=Zygotorulaspora mrakii TaxID=42260 RepID=A0A7H9B6B0_ZYGMR|nr:uncharacterized protein HG535_0F05550 [Zygotorulaspora mrakii]QLG74043.1 hypothetical protein HG535_0F05550 [Zygotorulaspora mrakii]